jgi:hypothetical protein
MPEYLAGRIEIIKGDIARVEKVIFQSQPRHFVTAALFLAAMLFGPLVSMIGGGVVAGNDAAGRLRGSNPPFFEYHIDQGVDRGTIEEP